MTHLRIETVLVILTIVGFERRNAVLPIEAIWVTWSTSPTGANLIYQTCPGTPPIYGFLIYPDVFTLTFLANALLD